MRSSQTEKKVLNRKVINLGTEFTVVKEMSKRHEEKKNTSWRQK